MFIDILNLIFPPKCIFCNEILPYQSRLEACVSCTTKIKFFKNYSIEHAKRLFNNKYCAGCICPCQYVGNIKLALKKFKFFDKPGYARVFAHFVTDFILNMTNDISFDIIVSVPLHKNKLKNRGYNQSYLIAAELEKLTGIKHESKVLLKIIDTKAQSLLGKEERSQNIKNAFCVENSNLIQGKNVLLIDDILTTGSTINECCKTLKEAGANNVMAAVVASGRKI